MYAKRGLKRLVGGCCGVLFLLNSLLFLAKINILSTHFPLENSTCISTLGNAWSGLISIIIPRLGFQRGLAPWTSAHVLSHWTPLPLKHSEIPSALFQHLPCDLLWIMRLEASCGLQVLTPLPGLCTA